MQRLIFWISKLPPPFDSRGRLTQRSGKTDIPDFESQDESQMQVLMELMKEVQSDNLPQTESQSRTTTKTLSMYCESEEDDADLAERNVEAADADSMVSGGYFGCNQTEFGRNDEILHGIE